MNLINAKHCITILLITFLALLSSSTLNAQQKQTRSAIQTQTNQPQMSEENKRMMQEIEMMREMIRDRREQQEDQRRVVQDLQQAVGNITGENTDEYYVPSQSSPSKTYYQEEHEYQPAQQLSHTPTNVTSKSTLSRIEVQEGQQYKDLERQYEDDMNRAQRQIDMLTQQLNTANTQLKQCEGGSIVANEQTSFYPEPQQPTQKKGNKAKKEKQASAPQQRERANVVANTLNENQAPPQMSEENKRMMQEIEMIRDMIKDRREQQGQQRKVLDDLQNQLN